MSLFKDIENLLQKKVVPVPPGWRTIGEVCEQEAVSYNTALRYLRKLIAAGDYETKKFPVIVSGKLMNIVHYRKHARRA